MWLEPREHVSVAVRLLAPVGAVVAALALCAVLIAWTGTGVVQAYGLLYQGALGSQFALVYGDSKLSDSFLVIGSIDKDGAESISDIAHKGLADDGLTPKVDTKIGSVVMG